MRDTLTHPAEGAAPSLHTPFEVLTSSAPIDESGHFLTVDNYVGQAVVAVGEHQILLVMPLAQQVIKAE